MTVVAEGSKCGNALNIFAFYAIFCFFVPALINWSISFPSEKIEEIVGAGAGIGAGAALLILCIWLVKDHFSRSSPSPSCDVDQEDSPGINPDPNSDEKQDGDRNAAPFSV